MIGPLLIFVPALAASSCETAAWVDFVQFDGVSCDRVDGDAP